MDLSAIISPAPPIRSTGRSWLRSLLALLMLVALSSCGSFEKVEVPVGMSMKARMDHFLAASRFISAMGIEAESVPAPSQMPPPLGTLLFLPAAAMQTQNQIDELDSWIYEGGNVVYFLQVRNEGELWDSTYYPPVAEFVDYEGIEIQAVAESTDEDAQIDSIYFGEGEQFRAEYLTDFRADFQFRFATEDDPSDYLLVDGYDYGEGSVKVLATGQLFTNGYLNKKEHADLLWDLVRYYDPQRVLFVAAVDHSFWALLWRQGKMAIIPLLLLLLVWIWSSMRRFGPVFATVAASQNTLSDHLTATGYFFSRHAADELIVTKLRDQHLPVLARRVGLAPTTDSETILSTCQQQGVLTPMQCSLMSEPLPRKGKDRLAFIQQLQQLLS